MVPQLKQLDSKDVTHTERLEAFQELSSLLEEMKTAIENKLYQKPSAYTKEARIEMAKENERIQEEKDKEKREQEEKQYGNSYSGIKKPVNVPVYNEKGDVRQCNQGGYEYQFYEKNEKGRQIIVLEVNVPKYLDTSKIDVDLNPTYVRMTIKGKILQLSFPCEILVDESQAKRSQTTGSLQILMPKQKNTLIPYFFLKEELEQKKGNNKKSETNTENLKKTEESEENNQETLEKNKKIINNTKLLDDEEIDDSDVPPLE